MQKNLTDEILGDAQGGHIAPILDPSGVRVDAPTNKYIIYNEYFPDAKPTVGKLVEPNPFPASVVLADKKAHAALGAISLVILLAPVMLSEEKVVSVTPAWR